MKYYLCVALLVLVCSSGASAYCENSACDTLCRYYGFDFGLCRGDECWCYKTGSRLNDIVKLDKPLVHPNIVNLEAPPRP